jgi:hypothetical protein
MPDIQITDAMDKPIGIAIDPKHPSSLLKYLKSELLHLAVVPDFLKRKDLPISQAATKPIQFQATVMHDFQLGNTVPEIDITPSAQATIGVNATPGTDLFDGDAFPVPATVPDHAAYVSIALQGSLDLDVSGSDGDLSFGLDETTTVSMQFFKAFSLAPVEPTLGDAVGRTFSSYVLPADISDLEQLDTGDIATISGQGKLKISGAVTAKAYPNPLASVDLPLSMGSIDLNAGATAKLSASFTLSGGYQVRARRLDADTIELSFLRQHGTKFVADLSAMGGVSAKLGVTDLASVVFGAMSRDPMHDKTMLADLEPGELGTLSDAIKNGLDHSLHASLDLMLSAEADDQALFQYRIQPAQLDASGSMAVHKALDGDLRLLTAMEEAAQDSGVLAPGIRMLNSLLSRVRKQGLTLHLNLIGLLNFVSVSDLIRKGEVLTDSVTGDVTIKETVTGNSIAAIVEPLKRNEALRKVLFDSLLATTCYRAGKAISPLSLSCGQVHFALNQNTNRQIMSDYLRWLVALHLLAQPAADAQLAHFNDGGPSTCVLRTFFGDADCEALFFDAAGQLRTKAYFLEVGRQAMRALLDPDLQPIDKLRSRILDDATWPVAIATGANVNLGPLVGISTDDPRVSLLIGDVYVISEWARAMEQSAASVQEMRALVGNADPATLMGNNQFKSKRDQLQKNLASMAKASKARFDEPWGMVSLFWAGGFSSGAYGKTVTQALTLELGSPTMPLKP